MSAESTRVAGEEGEPAASLAASVPAVAQRRLWARATAFNWRLFLVRYVAAGIAVIVTVLVVPGLHFTGWRAGQFLVVAAVYAVIAAVVKPLLEFLSLRFLVATYGLIVIVVNGLLLFLLVQLMPSLVEYHRLWQLLLGGFVVGALGLILETLLGATPPVLDSRREAR